jgi:hypothetical protein
VWWLTLPPIFGDYLHASLQNNKCTLRYLNTKTLN